MTQINYKTEEIKQNEQRLIELSDRVPTLIRDQSIIHLERKIDSINLLITNSQIEFHLETSNKLSGEIVANQDKIKKALRTFFFQAEMP